ncbi:tRNA pseudouridine(38-40) synthase TruA [Chitinophagaceae bacterium IBVUCB2]|nr:tRNA pseudouridine(38-40) synthase TruA [Chitinophagaceae bacterium IBVUCB2]
MTRYFLELAYKGTHYSGFQSQQNANSIQAEVEKALAIIRREKIILTGSSRTDAGVHAHQNFFHFDTLDAISTWKAVETEDNLIYKMNAILPDDIVIKAIYPVAPEAHCRFDALSREYKYHIYNKKDAFKRERAFFFPYKLDVEKMQQAASIVKEYHDFTSFSKRNTQVKTFMCQIIQSKWLIEEEMLVYNVIANRFLRGMVRALTATMLQVGRNKISLDQFRAIIEAKDCTKASFAVPPHGLFLVEVKY